MHRGAVGVDNLNILIQRAVSGRNAEDEASAKSRFLIGDRVIQMKNDYDVGGDGKSAMNGDIGYVKGWEERKRAASELSSSSKDKPRYAAATPDRKKTN